MIYTKTSISELSNTLLNEFNFFPDLQDKFHLQDAIDTLSDIFQGKNVLGSCMPIELSLADLVLAIKKSASQLNTQQLLEKNIVPMALFDFDGTLINASAGDTMRRYFTANKLVKPELRNEIDRLMQIMDLEFRPEAQSEIDLGVNQDLDRVLERHKQWSHQLSYDVEQYVKATWEIYPIYSLLYAGHKIQYLREIFSEIAKPELLPKYFESSEDLIESLKIFGVEPAIISASPDFLVKELVQPLTINNHYATGVRIKTDIDSTIGSELDGQLTFREGKVTRAQELFADYLDVETSATRNLKPLLAFGDAPSMTDQQMIESAVISVIIEPRTQTDREHAYSLAASGKIVFLINAEKTVSGDLVLSGQG